MGDLEALEHKSAELIGFLLEGFPGGSELVFFIVDHFPELNNFVLLIHDPDVEGQHVARISDVIAHSFFFVSRLLLDVSHRVALDTRKRVGLLLQWAGRLEAGVSVSFVVGDGVEALLVATDRHETLALVQAAGSGTQIALVVEVELVI